MRRLVLSLLATSSLALLTACGQGGTAFGGGSSGNASSIVFSTGGTTGVFSVRAGFPIVMSATAVAGIENVVTTNQSFAFSWGFAPSGTLYNNGSVSGAQQSACAAPPVGFTVPQVSILSNAGSNFVTVTPPGTVAGYGAGTTLGGSATAAAPYCVVLIATHQGDGVKGRAVILVTT